MTAQKPSRLELYIEILKTVENELYSKFSELQEKTHVDKKALVYAIDFLEKQGLIKTGVVANETVYESTPRGQSVTKFFANRTQVVPQGGLVCDFPSPKKDYSL
jgi:predicted transcriptional regulator